MKIDTIYTGDAFKLSKDIPDNSIDMIFTDPEYNKLDHYSWLAKTAVRVLKPDKPCLVWCSQPKLPQCRAVMEDEGLIYHYTFSYTIVAKSYRLFKYHIFCWTTPCLWMSNGQNTPYRWVPDTMIGNVSHLPTTSHRWNKNEEAIWNWLEAFTREGDVVLDPFTGGGVVPIVCKKLGRHYLAFEVDSNIAEQAKQHILGVEYHTQGLLF